MHVTIHFNGDKRADFVNHELEEILLRSLARFRDRLKQVYLYIEDVNGPRGGLDKQCRCVLHIRRMPPVVITDIDERLSSLIYRVANRAAYTLSQKLDRRVRNRRQPKAVRESKAMLYS